MTRVLITGASGFIGHPAMSVLIQRGFEVHAVSRQRAGLTEGAHWHALDLLAPGAPRLLIERIRPQRLLHLAWYAEPGSFWDSPENQRWVTASSDLLKAFALNGGERAVIAGSCTEYDWSVGGECRESATPLRPATAYGQAKLELYEATADLARRSGIEFGWARIFFVYGPREHPARLVSSVARKILAGERAPISEGTQVRDFAYVGDVGEALAAILDSTVQGAVNVASGTPVSVAELVRMIAEEAGGPDLVERGALPVREGDPPSLTADIRRLTEELGWRPRISLSAGVERTVAWWRREIAAPVKGA